MQDQALGGAGKLHFKGPAEKVLKTLPREVHAQVDALINEIKHRWVSAQRAIPIEELRARQPAGSVDWPLTLIDREEFDRVLEELGSHGAGQGEAP